MVETWSGIQPKISFNRLVADLLAQLGASVLDDACVASACTYLLAYSLTIHCQFSYNGTPSSTLD